jgi:hypothetical protein
MSTDGYQPPGSSSHLGSIPKIMEKLIPLKSNFEEEIEASKKKQRKSYDYFFFLSFVSTH